MFRRLNRQLGVHKASLNEKGWRVLTRAAFSLYLDSRPQNVPLFALDQFTQEVVQGDLDAAEALPASREADVHERPARVSNDLER